MTVDQQPRTSPLSGWQPRFDARAGAVRISEEAFRGQLNLRVAVGSSAATAVGPVLGVPLPVQPNTSITSGDVQALWLGPDECLLTKPGPVDELANALRSAVADGLGAVTDVSAQRTTIRIRGDAARELLAKGCSIDLHPRRSPKGTCVQTLLAQTGVVIVVGDDHGTDFTVLVRASFAQYLASWLLDASAEFGDNLR